MRTVIGAADADPIYYAYYGPGHAPITVPAGRAYAYARRRASRERTEAFWALPDFDFPPVQHHRDNGADPVEIKRGCPAW